MYLLRLLKFVVPTFAVLYTIWATCQLYWFTQLSVVSLLLVISWTLGYYLYELANTERVLSTNKAVLVTGCDTGFGHDLVIRLDNLGFHVYAGVLFPDGDGAKKLQQACSTRLRVVKMDVTKREDVESVVEQIKSSKTPLHAVVNNAGIGLSAPFDWGNDVDVYKQVFDVNTLAVVRVTRACIPLLRKSKGRVVNVASLAGRVGTFQMAHYAMAKHSVRVFSDVIRRELHKDDVQVVTIEPFFYQTPIIAVEQTLKQRERIYNESTDEVKRHYGPFNRKLTELMIKDINSISRKNIHEVVDALLNAVTLEHPKAFYRCCGYTDLLIWAVSHLPEILLDKILIFKYSKSLEKCTKKL